jgi:hypothetical protein
VKQWARSLGRLTAGLKSFPSGRVWLNVCGVESQHLSAASQLVPVEALRSGDPITDVHGGGEHYKVLESKCVCDGCVVLELESKADDRFRVIEKSFPSGYEVGRSHLRHW